MNRVTDSSADLADGVHRMWWKRMSDFWLDYHYDRGDHGCDDLFLSGETFLDWWTTHREGVRHASLPSPSSRMCVVESVARPRREKGLNLRGDVARYL